MIHPDERPDAGSINDATRRSVATDRAAVEDASRATLRRRHSLTGRAERVWRWLRNRQTGPMPRLRRLGGTVRDAARNRGPWRSLPDALVTALLAPVRLPSTPAPPKPPRDWSPERERAAIRLKRASQALAVPGPRRPALAVIAGAAVLGGRFEEVSALRLRPEDWAILLEDALARDGAPTLLLVASEAAGNDGPWAYRYGPVMHADAMLARDLQALTEWCSDRDLATIFIVENDSPTAAADWGGAARLFDLVLAPSAATASAISGRADRRGLAACVLPTPAGLDDILAAIGEAT